MISNSIPQEILEAVNRKFGFALLIKGVAGTGKTTLALEILKLAKNPFYISTRVSPEFLYAQFPWIQEFLPPSNIYNATQAYFPTIIAPQEKNFQTLNYDNVSNFIEMLMDNFQQVEEPTIVIDSWNAVTGYKNLEDNEIEKFTNLIMELVRKLNMKLIFVTEKPEISFLDYIADGVIINHDLRIEDRRVRVMELLKLRSIRINQPTYTYTLEAGRFKSFPAYKFQFPSILINPEPILDPNNDFISTGISDLDAFFEGGLKKSCFNLLEIAHSVGEGFLNFIIPLFTNHLNLGRSIIAILPEGYSAHNTNNLLQNFVDKNQFLKQIIYFDRLSEDPKEEEIKPYIQPLEINIQSTFKNIWEKADGLRDQNNDYILYFLALDKLGNMYQEHEILRELSDHIAHIKGNIGDLTVAFMREGQALINNVSHMAYRHWKIRLINKAMVIYGIQPESEFQLVNNDISKGYVTLELTPLV